jgi:hypothetical protein
MINHIDSIPFFERDIHFEEYSPKKGGYRYRYVTIKDTVFTFTESLIPSGQKILFKDSKGRVWMTITSYKIIISKNYAWDGCTPKKWWGIWWGTPDFESTILASLLHDVLIQFYKTTHNPFNRYVIDIYFKYIMDEHNFILSDIYYFGSRVGSMFPDKNYNVTSELTIISTS